MLSIYFYGVGGHAKVAADVAAALRIRLLGYFDDDKSLLSEKPVLVRPGLSLLRKGVFHAPDEGLVITIGSNMVRAKIAKQLLNARFQTLIHPSCLISPTCQIDDGTVVFHKAIVQAGTKIGKHVIINTAASVDHDNLIGDYSHVSPNATLCGNVSLGVGSQVGAGAVVLPGIKIGAWAMIGAGAVVTKDVADGATVVGNPARVVVN
ncbi:MAG: acetyltransferase [Planctomycetaceae bacterium]|nr:acetyltransferase [Planctomycetaceae bacterium]